MNIITRYLAVKSQEDVASYSLTLGAKEAYAYAAQNAKRYNSDLYAQLETGEYKLVASYK